MFDALVQKAKITYLLSQVTIEHLLEAEDEGRIRISYPKLRQDKALADEIKSTLGSIDAVTDYSINEVTGSVLVHYKISLIEKASFIDSLLTEVRRQYQKGGQNGR